MKSKMVSCKDYWLIHQAVVKLGHTKVEVARVHNTSPRTIGRIVDYVEECLEEVTGTGKVIGITFDEEGEVVSVEYERPSATYHFTAPQDSVSIVKIAPGCSPEIRAISSTAMPFSQVRAMLEKDQSQETLAEIFEMISPCGFLKSRSIGRISIDGNTEQVVFNKADGSVREVPQDVAEDIIKHLKDSDEAEAETIANFLDRLMDNPSFKAIAGLYSFIKINNLEINPDGTITAWRGIEKDLYSRHAGSIKSSPTITVDDAGRVYNGDFMKEIRVDRNEVDDNPNRACSHGLHVGSLGYATSWAPVTISVKVDPRDVVAVPEQYQGTKMRVCAYTPIEIIN